LLQEDTKLLKWTIVNIHLQNTIKMLNYYYTLIGINKYSALIVQYENMKWDIFWTRMAFFLRCWGRTPYIEGWGGTIWKHRSVSFTRRHISFNVMLEGSVMQLEHYDSLGIRGFYQLYIWYVVTPNQNSNKS
jgi:hypothetical protein